MTDIDKDMCRKAAGECIELARVTTDAAKKEVLLTRAQEWLKLAYANNDAEFGALIAGFNEARMMSAPVQRQPMQQQQSKIEPEDKMRLPASPDEESHVPPSCCLPTV